MSKDNQVSESFNTGMIIIHYLIFLNNFLQTLFQKFSFQKIKYLVK
jgi:hypothetical protein